MRRSPGGRGSRSATWPGSRAGSARSRATAKRPWWRWRSTPTTAALWSKGSSRIRAFLAAHRHPGLHSYVTGPGGVAADLEQVAEDAGQTLLFATLSLVLVLLLVVYRAPVLALLPLLTVGPAYLIAIGITYALIEAGPITVNTEGTLLLLVLIFGAGTDYSLLLIHRYREELGRAGTGPALRRRWRRACARSPPLPRR